MEWKENMSKEEFEQAIAQAKEGLFTQEQLNTKVQSETDKVRTEYSKKIKDLESKLPKEKTKKELELEERLADLDAKEKEYKIKDMLNKEKLPTELSKYINIADDDIDNAGQEITNILNNYMLDNNHKPKKHNKSGDAITKEQFSKMNYAERIKLEQSNPELYKKLRQ
ncbi:MAG TPA: hypothetical protein VK982_02230 [Bacteroidales bacterium]|nr:hypothetical protein [Bacteroidales bacterium]